MRKEVAELMRVSERLIGFAHQNGGLTEDECAAVLYYARELEKEVMPYCSQGQHPSQPSS